MAKQATSENGPQRAIIKAMPDMWLLGAVLCLAGLSLVMVMSASGIMAERYFDDKYHFMRKHVLFMVTGLCVLAVTWKVPRIVWYRLTYLLLAGAVLLLALTAFSPFGGTAGGATRWLRIGPFSLQALEPAKVALVFYLAYFFAGRQHLVKTFSVGFLPPVLVTGALAGLLLVQPDFGGAVFLCGLLFVLCFVGGTRIVFLGVSLILGLGIGAQLVLSSPYRVKRWLAFLDPFKDAQDTGYQLVQSLYALGNGHWFGVGLGASRQKLLFLPDAHNDFILAVLGEELGFMGVSAVFLLMAVILWRTLAIALQQRDLRDRLVATGMGMILVMGGLVNAAVVFGAAPPKGIPMPFLSYGGSHLLVCFFCVGMLLNLSSEEG
jgi:cell division protein FtsW